MAAAASNQELTDQAIAVFNRVKLLEAEVLRMREDLKCQRDEFASFLARTAGGRDGGGSGMLDKKRLYPRDFRKGASFRKWSERVVKRMALERQSMSDMFVAAAKSEVKVDSQRTLKSAGTSRPSSSISRTGPRGTTRRPRSWRTSRARTPLKPGGS